MEHDDTETESLRAERGESPTRSPTERQRDVPLAPHSAGIVGQTHDGEVDDGVAADRRAAEKRDLT